MNLGSAGRITVGYGQNSEYTKGHDILVGAVWNRALSDVEEAWLAENPFGLLKPATQQTYYAPATVQESPLIGDLTPLPKRYHPDFRNPRVKPVGPVEVDRDNPLARDLVVAYVPSMSLSRRDLLGSPISYNSVKPETLANQGVVAAQIGNSDSETDNSFELLGTESTRSALTVVVRSRPNNPSSDNGDYFIARKGVFVSTAAAGNNGFTYGQHYAQGGSPNPGTPAFTIQGVFEYQSPNYNLNGREFQTHGVSATSEGNADFYADGAMDHTTPIGAFTQGGNIYVGKAGAGDASGYLYSNVEFVFVFNRHLSAAEWAEIDRDPYQLLKPASSQVYFPNVAGSDLADVGLSQSVLWSAMAPVGKNNTLLWSMASAVGKSNNIQWGLIEAVGSGLSVSWDSVSAVGSGRTLEWALLQAVGNTESLSWDLLHSAGKASGINWDVLQRVGTDGSLQWDLLQGVSKSGAVIYSLIAAVGKSNTIEWDLNNPVTQVGKSNSLQWSMTAAVGKQIATEYSLLEAVGIDRSLHWDLVESIGRELSVAFDLAQLAGKEASLSWDGLAVTGRTVTLQYSLLSEGIVIPKHLMIVLPEIRVMTIKPENRIMRII